MFSPGPCSALALLFTALCTAPALAQVSSLGSTVVLGNISYFVPPTPAARLDFSKSREAISLQKSDQALVPFTFVTTSASQLSSDELDAVLANNSALDDVWTKSFLTGLYATSNSIALSASGKSSEFTLTSSKTPLSVDIPPGPYFVSPSTGDVFQAWRLFSDENQAFLYGTLPDGKGAFKQLSAYIDGAATESIAVPSRLYFKPTAEKPLAGARLAVKDIFDIKGLRTGCGNRAFYQLYPAKTATAPSIQRLLDGGAILVGKVKASQFANGETATGDWVDYHAPYNPRGDGYQDGSSSSTGSGAAVAAYPWLDYAVGSDTGASMRGPAAANGVFGNRPSHGAVPLDGVMPLSPGLDTAGIFARDAHAWKVAGDWWYQNFTQFNRFPSKILFPTDLWGASFLTEPPSEGTAGAFFNAFIKKLEGFLNTTRTEMSVDGMWNATSPLIANVSNPPPPLGTFLRTTYADLITLDQIALVADPFIADYKAAHGGRSPFIDPAPLARWGYGRTLDPTTRKPEALNNKTIFMNWFRDQVLEGTNEETCANSILLYPLSAATVNYRNEYIDPPTVPLGFGSTRIAVHAEVPDMVVPIGELPYNSTITLTTEKLPVTMSFMTQKGCDLMLFNLFAALQDAGILSPVMTGPTMFAPSR